MGVGHAKKKNCRSLARGISHGDKFGNLIGTCGRVAADKSDNVWHWHQACEWAMLKKKKLQKFGTGYFARGQIREPHKKIAEVWHGVFRTGTNSGTSKKNCRSLARGISHGDKFGNLKKKKIAEVWHGVFRTGTNSGTS